MNSLSILPCRDAERKARQLATSPSIASTRLLAVSKKKHHHHTHDQVRESATCSRAHPSLYTWEQGYPSHALPLVVLGLPAIGVPVLIVVPPLMLPCIASPQVQRAHHRHRRPQHVSRIVISTSVHPLFTSLGLSIHPHLPHVPVSLMTLLPLPQLQAVPEYYTGPPGVSYVGRQHPAHIGGEATLTLPQIEAKSYHPHPFPLTLPPKQMQHIK